MITFHRYETVESTNDIAIQMVKQGAPAGTAVTAIAQNRGRGRLDRNWWDSPGESLLMSVVLPAVDIEVVGQMAAVTGVAITEYLRNNMNLPAKLKWPNDVRIGNRKICGILVECTPTELGMTPIVGIGLNVNQKDFLFELSNLATSLALETGTAYDIEAITEQVAKNLFDVFDNYIEDGFEDILQRWRSYLDGTGQQAQVSTTGDILLGEITGLGDDGSLMILDDSGTEHSIIAAEYVRILPSQEE